MDFFNEIFDTLALKGVLYFRTDFSPPWGVTVPAYQSVARFHLVVQGRCLFKVENHPAVTLNAGDLIMIPHGASHTISDSDLSEKPPLEQVLNDSGYDGQGVLSVGEGDSKAATQLVCGHLSFRELAQHPILQAMPDYITLSNSCRAKHVLLDNILRMLTQQAFSHEIGAAASITRLSEIVFIELLKASVEDDPQLASILNGFQDPKIGKSLQLIHTTPQSPWTVESLATEVAMSRSRFSLRFQTLMGTGPMSYLADWRLQKALSLLDSSRLSVSQIADKTGYQSPSAFTRAFSGKFGVAPRVYRQSQDAHH